MRPRIVQFLAEQGLPGWWVPNFSVMLVLALAAGIYLTDRLWRRHYRDESVLPWMGIALPVAFLGAKVLYLLEYGWPADWRQMLSGGISLYGGLLGLFAGLWLAQRVYGFSLLGFLDCGAPALALTLAIGRVGCFLAGCNGGLPTSLPWGTSFPPQTSAHDWQVAQGLISPWASLSIPAHPVQLYESGAGLVACVLLLRLLQRRDGEGQTFLASMLWYATFRFVTEYMRADAGSWPVAGLTFTQVIALAAAIVATVLLVVNPSGRANREDREDREGESLKVH